MFSIADKKPARVLFIDQEVSSPEAEELFIKAVKCDEPLMHLQT